MALRRSGGTVAAIDIGTTKVCTLIGDLDAAGRIRVLGVGVTVSRGMKRGSIEDMAEVTAAVRRSVEMAEHSADGIRVVSAHVGVAGTHIGALNNKGLIALGNGDRPISADDMDRAVNSARTLAIPGNREVIHVLARHYTVDGEERVINPIGMHAHRLDVEAHVVTGAVSQMQNLKACVTNAGIGVDALILEPLASADAVLDEEERRHGVILADIGGGTTDLCIILNGAVYHTAVLQVGGDNVTQDLVVGIRVPFQAAEEAKEMYGHALPSAVAADETIEVEAFGSDGLRTVNRRRLCEIIQARMEEILEQIAGDVRRAGMEELVAAGLVLTGGGANLEGLERLAVEVVQMPVRVAYPHEVGGKSEIIINPAFATSIGLLTWAIRERGLRPEPPGGPRRQRPLRGSDGLMQKVQTFMRAMLP